LCVVFFIYFSLQAAGKAVVAEAAATAPENNRAQQQQVPRVNGVLTWRPRWQLLLARKTSTYGAVVLAIVLYCLVLLNCDVAFIGLAYLAVAVWCLAVQPQKGQWHVVQTVDDIDVLYDTILGARSLQSSQQIVSADAGTRSAFAELIGSSVSSWIPLFSASIVVTLDFVLQSILPVVVSSHYFAISEDVLNFLKNAVGLDTAPTGRELALGLMRPVLVLACIYTFRKLYSIGVLHRQLAHEALDQDEYEQLRVAKQWSVGAFVKRFLILHASKVVVIVAFAAAMKNPSALGWALVGKQYTFLHFLFIQADRTPESTAIF
jgi:hypothetical protein